MRLQEHIINEISRRYNVRPTDAKEFSGHDLFNLIYYKAARYTAIHTSEGMAALLGSDKNLVRDYWKKEVEQLNIPKEWIANIKKLSQKVKWLGAGGIVSNIMYFYDIMLELSTKNKTIWFEIYENDKISFTNIPRIIPDMMSNKSYPLDSPAINYKNTCLRVSPSLKYVHIESIIPNDKITKSRRDSIYIGAMDLESRNSLLAKDVNVIFIGNNGDSLIISKNMPAESTIINETYGLLNIVEFQRLCLAIALKVLENTDKILSIDNKKEILWQ